jgi:hypothetical protein
MTVVFGLKQLLSLLLITEAATLVPPDPKPVLSLTFILVSLQTRPVANDETYHGNELRCGREFELEAGGSGATIKLLIHDGADLCVIRERRWTIRND